jgi:hypothetical protein
MIALAVAIAAPSAARAQELSVQDSAALYAAALRAVLREFRVAHAPGAPVWIRQGQPPTAEPSTSEHQAVSFGPATWESFSEQVPRAVPATERDTLFECARLPESHRRACRIRDDGLIVSFAAAEVVKRDTLVLRVTVVVPFSRGSYACGGSLEFVRTAGNVWTVSRFLGKWMT